MYKKRKFSKYGSKNFNGMQWAMKKGIFLYDFQRKIGLMKLKVKDKIVLDVGCGNGENVFRFSSLCKEIHGIEVIDSCIEEAKKNNNQHNVFFAKGSAENIPHKDSKFDVVYLCWVIEHLEEPTIFFDEAYRVLKSGGILILWVPSILNPTGFFTSLISNKYKIQALSFLDHKNEDEVSHHKCYYKSNYVSLIDKLLENKFGRIFLERYDAPNYYSKYRFLTYLWYIRYRITNNKYLDFIKPHFHVEYKKI